jgi:hypothetical protein
MVEVSGNMVQLMGAEKIVQVRGSQHGCMSPDGERIFSLNAYAKGFSFGGTVDMRNGKLAMHGAMEMRGAEAGCRVARGVMQGEPLPMCEAQ